MTEIFSHGIVFIRSGECAQCGICGCDRDGCPHFGWKKGKSYCKIYTTRADYCAVCDQTHQGCIDFPDNPWIRHIRDAECAYTFERQDNGSMDELPFLFGEPWLRT